MQQIPANSVKLKSGGSVIKQGDETPFVFQFFDEKGNVVELQGATVLIKIANSTAFILEKAASINEDNTISFALKKEDITGHGAMRLEFHVIYEDTTKEIFPADGWQEIRITQSLDDIGQGKVSVITVEAIKAKYQEQIDDFKEEVNTSLANVDQQAAYAKTQGDYAKLEADRLVNVDAAQFDARLTDVSSQLVDVAINVKSFGAKLDGLTDDTIAIKTAIEYAKTNGYNKVKIPFTKNGFLVSEMIIIRDGISLVCDNAPMYRRNNFTYQKVIIAQTFTGVAVFALESHASIDGFVLYDPHQKYSLTSYTDSWVTGRPIGIQLGYSGYDAFEGKNVSYGNRINNIGFIGVLVGIEQHEESINVEALQVSNLRGMPLEIGVHIRQAYDVLRFNNIHFNLNSYAGLYTGDASQYFRKVGTTASLFKFGRVDDPIISECFSFGMKHFVHWYRDAFVGDSNNGGGAIVQGSSADACHVAFQVDRNGLGNFGVRVIGGFFVPVVKVVGSEQALIKFSGTATFDMFHLIGVRSFGDTVPAMGDATASDSTNYHIVWETTGINNIVMAVGCHFSQHVNGLTLGGNPSLNNRFSLMGSAFNNLLSNLSNANMELYANNNESPRLVLNAGIGSKYEIYSVGDLGNGHLRILRNGTPSWTFYENGGIELLRPGTGMFFSSPNGTLRSSLYLDDTGEAKFGGSPLGRKVNVPTSATATGQLGQWAADSSYLYICTAVNTWRRVALSVW